MGSDFAQLLERYADLVIRVGLNLRPGQRLLIEAPIEAAPLARLIISGAYQAGARFVDVLWSDDQTTLARFQYAPRDSFEEFPVWQSDLLAEYARRGDAIVSIYATDPELLANQDPKLVATVERVSSQHFQPYLDLLVRSAMNWLVISAPIPSWAAKVFPHEAPERQVERLWDAIFEVCRLKQDNPIAAWQAHIERMTAWAEYLNRKQYRALKYTAPGTDLTVGLPRGHLWKSARDTTTNGIAFTPNLPTEEVFTMPHREQVNGVVTSSRPLNYGGTLIDNFRLTFADGRVVEASAEAGEEQLRNLLATDEGASRLGEIALVPYSSPISQSGLLFYNTLFDENAASHIALGRAYAFTLKGGTTMSEEQLAEAGANHSLVHVDFMIGSQHMDIDGVCEDGTTEPVMRGGEWAFDAAP
jgi:aminopeptidase